MTGNFTAIDGLIEKEKNLSVSSSKETEPQPIKQEADEVDVKVEKEEEEKLENFFQTRQESIELPPDLKRLGLKTPPVSVVSKYQQVKTPISDDKILPGLHAPITSSLRWLATLAFYILKKAHIGLKTIHGRVVRIIKRN